MTEPDRSFAEMNFDERNELEAKLASEHDIELLKSKIALLKTLQDQIEQRAGGSIANLSKAYATLAGTYTGGISVK